MRLCDIRPALRALDLRHIQRTSVTWQARTGRLWPSARLGTPSETGHSKTASGDEGLLGAHSQPNLCDLRSPPATVCAHTPGSRLFFPESGHGPNGGTAWLPWEDSNSHVRSQK